MELKFGGYSVRIELVILFLVIGAIMGTHLFCSCTSFHINGMSADVGSLIKETFAQRSMLGSDDYGAPINYSMDTGVPGGGGWENAALSRRPDRCTRCGGGRTATVQGGLCEPAGVPVWDRGT